MTEYSGYSKTEIGAKISAQDVKATQIMNIAMVAGVILFTFLIIFLSTKSVDNPENTGIDIFVLSILIITLIIFALFSYLIVYFVPQFLFSSSKLEKRINQPFYDAQRNETNEPSLKLMQLFRIQMIIRLALLEFVSLFGLVLLFLSINQDYIDSHPMAWLLLTPALIQIVYTIKNYPTKDNIIEFIENNMLHKLR